MRMAIVARKDGEGAVVCKDGDGIEVIMLTTMIVLSLSLCRLRRCTHTHVHCTHTLHTEIHLRQAGDSWKC